MFGDLQQLGWPGICSTPGLLWWKQLNVAQLYLLLNRLITKGMTLHSQCTLRMSCARECVSVWVCVVGVSVCERYIVLNSWLNQNDFCHGVHPLWVTYPMMLRPKYQVFQQQVTAPHIASSTTVYFQTYRADNLLSKLPHLSIRIDPVNSGLFFFIFFFYIFYCAGAICQSIVVVWFNYKD